MKSKLTVGSKINFNSLYEHFKQKLSENRINYIPSKTFEE